MRQSTPSPQHEMLAEMLGRLRPICMDLPQVLEVAAWQGTRWTIRRKNFAHLLVVADGQPPAYARAAGLATDTDPACLLTFRSELQVLDIFAFDRAPFFRPGWWPDIVGMRLDADTDWDEVDGLVTASYRRLAPQKLAALIGLPRNG